MIANARDCPKTKKGGAEKVAAEGRRTGNALLFPGTEAELKESARIDGKRFTKNYVIDPAKQVSNGQRIRLDRSARRRKDGAIPWFSELERGVTWALSTLRFQVSLLPDFESCTPPYRRKPASGLLFLSPQILPMVSSATIP
jgi:hypothetical protein